jgi:hypothetical protein
MLSRARSKQGLHSSARSHVLRNACADSYRHRCVVATCLCLLPPAQSEEVRKDPTVLQLSEALRQGSGGQAAVRIAEQLLVVLAGAQEGARAGGATQAAGSGAPGLDELIAQGPGGRHDNDSADYRSIRVLPTSEEVRRPDRLVMRQGWSGERGERI